MMHCPDPVVPPRVRRLRPRSPEARLDLMPRVLRQAASVRGIDDVLTLNDVGLQERDRGVLRELRLQAPRFLRARRESDGDGVVRVVDLEPASRKPGCLDRRRAARRRCSRRSSFVSAPGCSASPSRHRRSNLREREPSPAPTSFELGPLMRPRNSKPKSGRLGQPTSRRT